MKAILLVDHGSRRRAANEMLDCVARLVAYQAGSGVVVRTAHLELAAPTVEDGMAACVAAGADEIIVHPYMLSPGRHATKDLPAVVADVATRLAVRARVTDPLGIHPLLGQIVLERCGVAVSQPASRPVGGCPGDRRRCRAPWCQ